MVAMKVLNCIATIFNRSVKAVVMNMRILKHSAKIAISSFTLTVVLTA